MDAGNAARHLVSKLVSNILHAVGGEEEHAKDPAQSKWTLQERGAQR